MIVDLQRFIANERPFWTELEKMLNHIEGEPNARMSLQQLQLFHLLYERTAAGLAKITTFSAEPEIRRYLENLVSRAYGEIHETREKQRRIFPVQWFFTTLPQTFRRHVRAFHLSLAITIVGCLFGGGAIAFDPASKSVLMPFPGLMQDPVKRVQEEEKATHDRLKGYKATFAADLMTHNTKVAIFTLALGMTWGFGTILMLFYNGVILGAVAVDYMRAGETKFLLGWLMPHGVIEIPSILIAGQAGLILAMAIIGYGSRHSLRARLRAVAQDVMTLIFGVAVLLVWAGFIESFLSQYHEPVIPYDLKIAFGCVELILLILFLSRSGRRKADALKSGVETPTGTSNGMGPFVRAAGSSPSTAGKDACRCGVTVPEELRPPKLDAH